MPPATSSWPTRGPAGPAGTPGAIDLLQCGAVHTRVVKVNGKKVKVKVRSCTGHLVKGSVTVLATNAKASLTRKGVVYASGRRTTAGARSRLMLRVRRRMTAGAYVLSYRSRVGRRWVTVREHITLSW